MTDTKVTVVVPVYKAEPFLDRCVESLVNQTHRDLEIILVDDGSPDRSPGMCDAWARRDSRIKVIHKQNAGAGMARNSGIEAASGSFITFVDSDDYIDPSTVEKALKALLENGVQIAVYGLTRINARGEAVKQLVPRTEKTCFKGREVQEEFLPDLIDPGHRDVVIRDLTLSNWSALYSMELVSSVNWRFVSERELFSEDSYSLIWLYSHVSGVVIVPQALYYYCENVNSLTQTYQQAQFRKIRSFYTQCTQMAAGLGFDRKILVRISGLFLAFSIATMKQLAAAQMPRRQRRTLLVQIINDDIMQTILADPDCRYHSRFRQILFFAMRRKLYAPVYCFLKLRLALEGL